MSNESGMWAAALCAAMVCGHGRADGLAVSEAKLTDPVKGGAQTVRFDLQWENSWRNDLAGEGKHEPNNYDAAWVFMKYRVGDGPWKHATLSAKAEDHGVPGGVALSVGQTDGKGLGVFVHRDANGMGRFAAKNVGLCWLRGADQVPEGAKVTVKVFGLEMAYVPQGAFWLGDGLADAAQFHAGGGGINPFKVNGEAQIAIGPAAGNLYYDKAGEWSGDQAGVLSAAYPKGYAAFCGMKYELTQGQYADYLSTLTPQQADVRWDSWWKPIPSSAWGSDARKCGIVKKADGTYESALPLKACGFLRWADMAAYLDWAALRPMTELEFEKACRGPLTPVAGEFAWGDAACVQVEGLTNEGKPDERPTNFQKANIALNKCVMMRVGCLGIGTGSRRLMGAGYYGMMELSGNQLEPVASAGSAQGREFTGLHGNGALAEDGFADVPNWPGRDAKGAGWRGGGSGWAANVAGARVSDRGPAALGGKGDTDGHYLYGVRGVRAAP